MIDLLAEFGHAYRIALDESATVDRVREERPWHYRILCRRGHVYAHGPQRLGAYTDRPRLASRLAATPGVRVHQRGDNECTVVFDFDRQVLEDVLALLKPRKRRRPNLTDAQRSAARDRMAAIRGLRVRSRPQGSPAVV